MKALFFHVAALSLSCMGSQSFLKEPLKVFKSFGLKLPALSEVFLSLVLLRLESSASVSTGNCSMSGASGLTVF